MPAALEVHNLTKSFGTKVVDAVSFTVEESSAVGIVGPNGAGKTTLFNLIAGDLQADEGSVVIAGTDVTGTSAAARCRGGVGRTSQIPRPFEGMSVFENVLVAATFGTDERRTERQALPVVVDALDRAGMADLANQTAGSLTLLQRKRLELARALATEPRLLLLDEIAGGLTEGEVHELIETVRSIHAEGVTIVWIEHIVRALLAVVDSIVAIASGAKIAEGDPHDVMSSAIVQEVYLGVVDES